MKEASAWLDPYEYQKLSSPGACWIIYKGRVRGAWMDKRGFFLLEKESSNFLMNECITGVAPISDSAKMPGSNGEIKNFNGIIFDD